MAQAGQNLTNTPRFPPNLIGVSVMEQGTSEPAETWEQAIRDAIERQGFKTASRFFHGRGAAAGGPEMFVIFQALRHVVEFGGAVSLLIALEQSARKRLQRRRDSLAVGDDRNVPLLFVQLSHGRPIDTTDTPPLTTRDLVRVLPAVRQVLDEHPGKYLIDLEGGTQSGGSLCVYWLESQDLQSRALRRLCRLAEEAQSRSDDIAISGVTLRTFLWQPPWKHRKDRKHSQ
jgi:hypothetical protein